MFIRLRPDPEITALSPKPPMAGAVFASQLPPPEPPDPALPVVDAVAAAPPVEPEVPAVPVVAVVSPPAEVLVAPPLPLVIVEAVVVSVFVAVTESLLAVLPVVALVLLGLPTVVSVEPASGSPDPQDAANSAAAPATTTDCHFATRSSYTGFVAAPSEKSARSFSFRRAVLAFCIVRTRPLLTALRMASALSHTRPMLSREESLGLVETYLRAIESKDAERVRACLHPELAQHEYPNQLVTTGANRDLAAVLEGLARGAQVLTAERYEIEDALVDGDRVACRVHWEGTLGFAVLGKQAGEVLEARFGVFFRLQQGKIVEQHNFDCFYP